MDYGPARPVRVALVGNRGRNGIRGTPLGELERNETPVSAPRKVLECPFHYAIEAAERREGAAEAICEGLGGGEEDVEGAGAVHAFDAD